MFQDTRAYSSFSVNSLAEAKAFYGDLLGLAVSEHEDELNLNIAGGTQILLYLKPNHTPATFTILNFPVTQIERVVDQLSVRGVRFEQYAGDFQTDEQGIFRSPGLKQAWFKDPAGNILSLHEAVET